MGRRTVGVILCLASALLLATRYIAAAIFGSNVESWSREIFLNMLTYTGTALNVWSLIALIAGIGYLMWAEVRGEKTGRQ